MFVMTPGMNAGVNAAFMPQTQAVTNAGSGSTWGWFDDSLDFAKKAVDRGAKTFEVFKKGSQIYRRIDAQKRVDLAERRKRRRAGRGSKKTFSLTGVLLVAAGIGLLVAILK